MASSLGYSEINSTPTLTKIKNQSHSLNGKKKITSDETEKLFKQLRIWQQINPHPVITKN